MISILKNKNLAQHFLLATVVALMLRILSAYFVFGPQALDDYLNQILPALRMDQGLLHDLPAHRSPLMIWILLAWLKLGHLFGIESVLSQIRWLYFELGIFSLLSLVGVYFYFENEKTALAGKIALYLVAAQGLMPFISTRAFLESFSACFLMLGIGLLAFALRKKSSPVIFLGLFILGFAALIRPQAGLIYLFSMGYFLFNKKWRYLSFSILAGLAIAGCQILIEAIDHRSAMSTIIAYLEMNKNVSEYGTQPWYSTWFTWLALFYFPFSFALFRYVKIWRQHVLLVGSVLVFVLAHSLVPHKEERFLYPVTALTMMMMALLWAQFWNKKSERFLFRPFFIVLNTFVLGIGCFVNTQVGEIGVPAEIQQRSNHVIYFDRDSLMGQGFMFELFLRENAKLEKIEQPLDDFKLEKYLPELSDKDGFVILTSNPQFRSELQIFAKHIWQGFQCSNENEKVSWTDAVVYKMNPQRNYRRRPTWYVACWR